VQVGPMNLTLKAAGPNRLILHYDDLVSGHAFKFNLRRYSKVYNTAANSDVMAPSQLPVDGWRSSVGRCRLTLSNLS
jgi:hypothetical protein